MDVVNFIDGAQTLSAAYIDADDMSLKCTPVAMEQDIILFDIPAFNNIRDASINNYSALYLTDKLYAEDIFNFKTRINNPPSLTTRLGFFATNINDTKYIYINDDTPTLSASPYELKLKREIIFEDRSYFEIKFINSIYCQIFHKNKDSSFYLVVNDDLNIYFDNRVYSKSITACDDSVFQYILDNSKDNIVLFKQLSSTQFNNEMRCLGLSGNKLSLIQYSTGGITPPFNNSNRLIIDGKIRNQNISPKLNTSWVAYTSSSNTINNEKSITSLPNNILISTQYSTISNNRLTVNALKLKNQLTENNIQSRGDYMSTYIDAKTPNVDYREYNSIESGSNQEKGADSLVMVYNFYNSDYVFKADQYTAFITPQTLYPFESININDTLIARCGAIGGDSPHTADKIYSKSNQFQNRPYTGEYLCTWLSGGNVNTPGIWVDRYFNPAKINISEALSSSSLKLSEVAAPASCPLFYFSDKNYFDVKSNLLFTPETEYIYQRIGKNYIKNYLSSLDPNTIKDSITLKRPSGALIPSLPNNQYEIYDLSNAYDIIKDYNKINIDNQFTFSFWLQKKDWSTPTGHQLAGNYTNKGMGIINDSAITPFIMVQDLNRKYIDIYNTSFRFVQRIDIINNVSKEEIIDIIRGEHLEVFFVITNAFNVYKIQPNGPVFDKKKIAQMSGYANYTIEGNFIYLLENDSGLVTVLDIYLETIQQKYAIAAQEPVPPRGPLTQAIPLPGSSGYGPDVFYIPIINSIVVKDGIIHGFRGDKAIQSNSTEVIMQVKNSLIAKENFDHTTRTILMSSLTYIRDFAIDKEENLYVLHGKGGIITKFTSNRDIIYSINMSSLSEEPLSAISVDIVREYVDSANHMETYPIVLQHNEFGDLFLSKVNESTREVQTVAIEVKGRFLSPCDGNNTRYNLTNFKYLKQLISKNNKLTFRTKINNLFDNREPLFSDINFSIDHFENGSAHHFVYRADSQRGTIALFVDGEKIETVYFQPAQYTLQKLFSEGFFFGSSGFYNFISLGEFLGQRSHYHCTDTVLIQPRLYNKAINDIDVKMLNLYQSGVSDISVSFPAGERNQKEQIKRFFKWQLPGHKSNNINIIVRNSNLSDDLLNSALKGLIAKEIESVLPANISIKNIIFKNS